MSVTIDHTILAYLLALQDFSGQWTDEDKQKLQDMAKDLGLKQKSPKKLEIWEKYTKPSLLTIIQGNKELNKSYQFYKNKLDKLPEIPTTLVPQPDEINNFLISHGSSTISRGFKPKGEPLKYKWQLENIVIVVNQEKSPEKVVKELKFLDRVKQFLEQQFHKH